MQPGEIAPFRIDVPDEVLADLADRLGRTRWPERETAAGWQQGVPLETAQALADHWATGYDWRERESRLNRFPQHLTEIDGLPIHFAHVRSPEPAALPLVLTHGWPGSWLEFAEVIGPLSDPAAHGGDPADAFHVVCPSLPGFGWSGKPASPGWGTRRVAQAWATLMDRLGYRRYGAQGGDWGSMVTTLLGATDPDHVAGVHLNMVIAGPGPDDGEMTDEEREAVAAFERYMAEEAGYSLEQSTRPQTVGYGLVDSPVGQMTWIIEKFWAWTDTDGDPVGALGADRLLDNVMVYWLNRAGASSARIYWESFRQPPTDRVEVPAGMAIFPKELFRASRRWAAHQYTDIRRWSVMERGGHFAAMEQPQAFVDEVRAFFRTVR
jgi:pimeloyl-ACP methyl ester carboxylesterase